MATRVAGAAGLALALLAHGPCALAQTASAASLAPIDLSAEGERYNEPQPGRAPLVIESTRAAQRIAVVDGWTHNRLGQPVHSTHDVCTTPCRLYVPDGRFELQASWPGYFPLELPLDVPAGGLRVRVEPRSLYRWLDGLIVTALSPILFGPGIPVWIVGSQPLFIDHSISIVGASMTLSGAAMLAAGITLMATAGAGRVVAREPLHAPAVAFSAAPTPGGAMAGLTLRF